MAMMGKTGLQKVADLCLQKSHYAACRIAELPGYTLRFNTPFFKEFVIQTPGDAAHIVDQLAGQHILAGVSLGCFPQFKMDDCLLIAVTERRTKAQIDRLVDALGHII